MLAHSLRHIAGHGKSSGSCRGHYTGGIARVRTTIRLGKFESCKISSSFVPNNTAKSFIKLIVERKIEKTDVVKELGNVLKNCLCVVKSRDTIKVAKRSRVSYSNVVK